ncbi:GAG-pre-integrase domain-containing protein [Candidatus Bathyarchaeota archaeon]|nr:GAG-pre-integrase domain-containing protein [Candidatus Bathyarchaeota archaeon]
MYPDSIPRGHAKYDSIKHHVNVWRASPEGKKLIKQAKERGDYKPPTAHSGYAAVSAVSTAPAPAKAAPEPAPTPSLGYMPASAWIALMPPSLQTPDPFRIEERYGQLSALPSDLPPATGLSLLNQNETSVTRDDIVWDSGCQRPSFNDLKWFVDIDKGAVKGSMMGVGGTASVKAVGTVQFKVQKRGQPTLWTKRNVAYVPSLPLNLLSVSCCSQRGLQYDYKGQAVVDTYHRNRRVASIEIKGGLYCLITTGEAPGTVEQPTVPQALACAQLNAAKPTIQLMHERLCHAGKDRTLRACREAGISITKGEADSFHCKSCALGKSTELVSRVTPVKHSLPGQFYADLFEIKPPSKGTERYAFHIIERTTGYH